MAKAQPPTKAQRKQWERLRELGCLIDDCQRHPIEIHHCGTGGGGRKNHDKVIPLCQYHHRGPDGIDGRQFGISKRIWQEKHGTEASFLKKAEQKLAQQESEDEDLWN